MILYHGTTESLGKIILEDGLIKSDTDRVFTEEVATTNGYVYLTNKFVHSVDFGNRVAIMSSFREKFLYVFEVSLDHDELLPDLDEVNPQINMFASKFDPNIVHTYESTLELVHSARIARPLKLGVDVRRYTILASGSNYDDDNSLFEEIIMYRNDEDYKIPSEVIWQVLK